MVEVWPFWSLKFVVRRDLCEGHVEAACSHSPRLCILGDINTDLLVPSLLQTKLLLFIMRRLKLVDPVGEPTRVSLQ